VKRPGIHCYDLSFPDVAVGFTTSAKVDDNCFREYPPFPWCNGYRETCYRSLGGLAGENTKSGTAINAKIIAGCSTVDTGSIIKNIFKSGTELNFIDSCFCNYFGVLCRGLLFLHDVRTESRSGTMIAYGNKC
jgi:hypothetical protein